jgi:hypothetical protein
MNSLVGRISFFGHIYDLTAQVAEAPAWFIPAVQAAVQAVPPAIQAAVPPAVQAAIPPAIQAAVQAAVQPICADIMQIHADIKCVRLSCPIVNSQW